MKVVSITTGFLRYQLANQSRSGLQSIALVLLLLSLVCSTQTFAATKSELSDEIQNCIASQIDPCLLQHSVYTPDNPGSVSEDRVLIIDTPITIAAPLVDSNNAARIGERDKYQSRTLDRVILNITASNVTLEGLRFENHASVGNPVEGGVVLVNGSSNTILNCTFSNMYTDSDNGGSIIKVSADGWFGDNQILGNRVTGWGNAQFTVQAIKIGEERLQRDGTYTGHPQYENTLIRSNTIERFYWGNTIDCDNGQFNCDSTQSAAIQVFNPSTIEDNVIVGSVNGISTKGNNNIVRRNTISRIFHDGALYMRDGNNNVFQGNEVFDSAVGFYAWSGVRTQFINNYFHGVQRLGTIVSAGHTGSRGVDWTDAAQAPLQQNAIRTAQWNNGQIVGYTAGTSGETSYQFTNDQTLFVNNSFSEIGEGIKWQIWVPSDSGSVPQPPSGHSYEKPTATYFLNNNFYGNAWQRVRFFMEANQNGDEYVQGDPLSNSISLFNNQFPSIDNTASDSYGHVPEQYLSNANDSGVMPYLPWRVDPIWQASGSSLDPQSNNYDGGSRNATVYVQTYNSYAYWLVYTANGTERYNWIGEECRTEVLSRVRQSRGTIPTMTWSELSATGEQSNLACSALLELTL